MKPNFMGGFRNFNSWLFHLLIKILIINYSNFTPFTQALKLVIMRILAYPIQTMIYTHLNKAHIKKMILNFSIVIKLNLIFMIAKLTA